MFIRRVPPPSLGEDLPHQPDDRLARVCRVDEVNPIASPNQHSPILKLPQKLATFRCDLRGRSPEVRILRRRARLSMHRSSRDRSEIRRRASGGQSHAERRDYFLVDALADEYAGVEVWLGDVESASFFEEASHVGVEVCTARVLRARSLALDDLERK